MTSIQKKLRVVFIFLVIGVVHFVREGPQADGRVFSRGRRNRGDPLVCDDVLDPLVLRLQIGLHKGGKGLIAFQLPNGDPVHGLPDALGVAVAVEFLASSGLHQKIEGNFVAAFSLQGTGLFRKEILVDHRQTVHLVGNAGLFRNLPLHRILGGLAHVYGPADGVEIILRFVACKEHAAVLHNDSGGPVAEPILLHGEAAIVFLLVCMAHIT